MKAWGAMLPQPRTPKSRTRNTPLEGCSDLARSGASDQYTNGPNAPVP